METLGERIKFLRGAHSQRWLAEQLNIPQTTLSNYENNKAELNFSMIDALTSLFQVNTDWLLFGRGEIRQNTEDSEMADKNERIRQLEKMLLEAKDGEKEAWREAAKAYRLAAVSGNWAGSTTQNEDLPADEVLGKKIEVGMPTSFKLPVMTPTSVSNMAKLAEEARQRASRHMAKLTEEAQQRASKKPR